MANKGPFALLLYRYCCEWVNWRRFRKPLKCRYSRRFMVERIIEIIEIGTISLDRRRLRVSAERAQSKCLIRRIWNTLGVLGDYGRERISGVGRTWALLQLRIVVGGGLFFRFDLNVHSCVSITGARVSYFKVFDCRFEFGKLLILVFDYLISRYWWTV